MTEIALTELDRERLKRAVKEALDDKKMDDIAHQLTALSTQMTEGFTAVHTRQEIANGRTGKIEVRLDNNDKDIEALQKAETKPTFWDRNQDKIIWGIVGIIVMLFYYLLTHNGFPNFLAK